MRLLVTLAFFLSLIAADTWADQISIPYPPQANTKAKAAEMKANLDAIVAEVNEQDLRVGALESPQVFEDNVLSVWGATGFDTIYADCDANPNALQEKWGLIGKKRSRVAVKISGTCLIDERFLFIFSQHVILDGGAKIFSIGEPRQCETRATIKMLESSGNGFTIDTSNNASLFLFCLNLEAKDFVTLEGYGNAYIRTFVGVSAVNDNLEVGLVANSTFRNNDALSAEDNSLLALQLTEGSTAALRSASIGSLRLYGRSSVTFSAPTNVLINNLTGQHRSTITVTGLSTEEGAGISLGDCVLTTESVFFLENTVFRDTTDCNP